MQPKVPTVRSTSDFYQLMRELGIASLFAERPGSVSGGENGELVEMNIELATLESIADRLYDEGEIENVAEIVLDLEEGESAADAPGIMLREGIAQHVNAHVQQAACLLSVAKVMPGGTKAEVPVR